MACYPSSLFDLLVANSKVVEDQKMVRVQTLRRTRNIFLPAWQYWPRNQTIGPGQNGKPVELQRASKTILSRSHGISSATDAGRNFGNTNLLRRSFPRISSLVSLPFHIQILCSSLQLASLRTTVTVNTFLLYVTVELTTALGPLPVLDPFCEVLLTSL